MPGNVWVVTLTSFLTDISSEMLTWLLPLFLRNVLRAGTPAIGLIEGTAESTASLLKVGTGWLSDRIGRRKWLAVAGYAISTVSKPFLLIVGTSAGVLWVRLGDRIGKGIRTAPRDALVADCTPAALRGLAFGIHRAGDTAGAVVGVLAALVVVELSQSHARELSATVFRTLVAVSVIPAVLAVAALAVLARELPATIDDGEKPGSGRRSLGRRFPAFLLCVLVFTLGNSSDVFLVLRSQQAGLSVQGVLGMVFSYNVVYAALSAPAGHLSDLVGRRRLLISGWIVYAFIYLGFARVSDGWQAWVLMTIYGVYAACTEGVARALVADLVPATARGTAYGLFHTAVGLAALPASVIAGLLWDGLGPWSGWGPSAPFYFGAAMAMAASILLCALSATENEGSG
jgi:MFS family permease